MEKLLFIICFASSVTGAITGIGGGVIIKPVTDALRIIPVDALSFLSGCTVLAMSAVSVVRRRKQNIRFDFKLNIALSIGAAVGGAVGKYIFGLFKNSFGNDALLLIIQSAVLAVLTAGVFVYMLNKKNIHTLNVTSTSVRTGTGLILGVFSSFLGIGGGPINLMALSLLFGMDAKEAASSSLFIILVSQIFSLIFSISTGSIPEFSPIHLLVMAGGGVAGGIVGNEITKRISVKNVENVFMILLFVIIGICFFNIAVNI